MFYCFKTTFKVLIIDKTETKQKFPVIFSTTILHCLLTNKRLENVHWVVKSLSIRLDQTLRKFLLSWPKKSIIRMKTIAPMIRTGRPTSVKSGGRFRATIEQLRLKRIQMVNTLTKIDRISPARFGHLLYFFNKWKKDKSNRSYPFELIVVFLPTMVEKKSQNNTLVERNQSDWWRVYICRLSRNKNNITD